MSDEEILSTHLQEVRRGTIVVACLHLLRRAGYGYGLLEELERRGFTTDGNTLYPLLRRLEKQGFLSSEWNTDESRPRKFYRTTAAGIRLADELTAEWSALATAIAEVALAPGSAAADAPASAPAPTSSDEESTP